MEHIIRYSTPTAEWQKLVCEAQHYCGNQLTVELESYLVFLLERFVNRPEIAGSVLALEFLESLEVNGQIQQNQLRDIGDKCLLFSGLFPEHAEKKRVSINYFVELGQHAYDRVAVLLQQQSSLAKLYVLLEKHFVELMDTLQSLRELGNPEYELSLLHAEELFRQTKSRHAQKILTENNISPQMLECIIKRLH